MSTRKNNPSKKSALLLALSFCLALLPPAVLGQENDSATTITSASAASEERGTLTGKAETNIQPLDDSALTSRLYKKGLAAVDDHMYAVAKVTLSRVIHDGKALDEESGIAACHLGLARVALAELDFRTAERELNLGMESAKSTVGYYTPACVNALNGLAKLNYLRGNYKHAQEQAEEAVSLAERLGEKGKDSIGSAQLTLSMVLAKRGFDEEATRAAKKAIYNIEHQENISILDLADDFRQLALLYQALKSQDRADFYFNRSCFLKEKALSYSDDPKSHGTVAIIWEPGSPFAHEIIDNEFPLRYLVAGGVRVSCTTVDLWELMCVLVTVTNVTQGQEDVQIGQACVYKLPPKYFYGKAEILEAVNTNRIDKVRRERQVWDLTYNRPWLANIQKTRPIRGLVPVSAHDLFRGPNIFADWGQWPASQKKMPDRFGIQGSPESLQLQAQILPDAEVIKEATRIVPGVNLASLDPFESRTGQLFYIYPRGASILVKVNVGNGIFELPFATRVQRIN